MMNAMDDLPNTGAPATNPPDPTTGQGVTYRPSGAKEFDAVGSSAELPIRDTGKEIQLPREVVSAGVRPTPTTVQLPPAVTQMGVRPAPHTQPVGNGKAVTLPLTNPQISSGLNADVATSWRWLAEWCLRRIKQLRAVHKA